MNKMKLIVDLAIHEKAKLSREKFITRVQSVQAIRTNYFFRSEPDLTFYISSLGSFMQLNHLHDAIVKGDFDGLNGHYGCYHAGIEISDDLFAWLRNTASDTILRQVICWLASLRWAGFLSDSMDEHEHLYPPIIEEVQRVEREYFPPFPETQDEVTRRYHTATRAYYGSVPPKLLWEPAPLNNVDAEHVQWGVSGYYDISIGRFYFSSLDWKNIVIEGKDDSLKRAESSTEYWEKIKHQYIVGASKKENVFSLFSAPPERGYVYIIRAAETAHYKIGYTQGDPTQRMTALQTGNAVTLSLVGNFGCSGKNTEKLVHELFAKKRLSGEWFHLTDDDVSNLLDEEWRAGMKIF